MEMVPLTTYIREGNEGISGFQASLFVCTQGNYEKMYEIVLFIFGTMKYFKYHARRTFFSYL